MSCTRSKPRSAVNPLDLRREIRAARTGPKLSDLHAWFITVRTQLSQISPLAGAIHYALSRWRALTRNCQDGRIEIDNNAAERSLRVVALGRKNYRSRALTPVVSGPRRSNSLLGTASSTVWIPKAMPRAHPHHGASD